MKTYLNTTRRGLLGAIALAASMLCLAAPASADDMSDLKDRFQERASKLLALRNAGTVGETFDGWVAVVKNADGAAKALIDAENADRKRLYEIISAKQGTKPEVVAERNAIRIFKQAAPDHYLKVRDGSWVQKKNVKIDE